jgi:hypothetical protein
MPVIAERAMVAFPDRRDQRSLRSCGLAIPSLRAANDTFDEGGSTMKRSVMLVIVGLVLAVLLTGTGWASSTTPAEEIQVTGTVLKGGRLVDDQGHEYQMAKDEGGLQLEGQVGQKIEVKGTVMENDGQKIIKINDYKIIKE